MRLVAYAVTALHALIAFGTLLATQMYIPTASPAIATFLLCTGVIDLLVGVFAGIMTSRRDLTVLAGFGFLQLGIGGAALNAEFTFGLRSSAVVITLLGISGIIWMVLGNHLKKAAAA